MVAVTFQYSWVNSYHYLKRTHLILSHCPFGENIRSNLLNSKKFVFLAFEFSHFNIQCPDEHITWGDTHKVCEFDTNLQSHLVIIHLVRRESFPKN